MRYNKFFLTALAVPFSIFISVSYANTDANTEILGKKTFENACAGCHTGGMKGWISGAPSIKEQSDWKDYLPKGLVQLQSNIIKGTDKHEPMGDCEECTEDDVKSAVDYIYNTVK